MFFKNEKELKTLIKGSEDIQEDIDMEFGIEKCVMLIMKSGKQHIMEKIELPIQEKIRMLGNKKTYKYLEISEANSIKQMEMKKKK